MSGPQNNLLSMDIIRNSNNTFEILCRPLTQFEGNASCEVSYRTEGSSTVYTKTSKGVGGAGDMISVLLPPFSVDDTVVSVAVTTRNGKQDVVIEGTFKTGMC